MFKITQDVGVPATYSILDSCYYRSRPYYQFIIRRTIPSANFLWNDQVDFASDYETEIEHIVGNEARGLPNPLHSAARHGTPPQVESTAKTGTKSKVPRGNVSSGSEDSDTFSKTVIRGQQQFVGPRSNTPSAASLRPQRHNTRLYLSKKIGMLHRREDEIGTQEYRHVAHSSNVLFGSPDLGEENRAVRFKTSTAMRPE